MSICGSNMQITYCSVLLLVASSAALAQECLDGIGFVEGLVETCANGSVIFNPPDSIAIAYDTEFFARVSTDNGSGEIEGRVTEFPLFSEYFVGGFAGPEEFISADVIINVPAEVAFQIIDGSNVNVTFEPGGIAPGSIQLIGGPDEGVLSTGTYRFMTSAGFDDDRVVSWKLVLFAAFEELEPPCSADLAEPCGVLNFDDVLAFLDGFAAMDESSDLALPFGVWNFDDVIAFLVQFGTGCP